MSASPCRAAALLFVYKGAGCTGLAALPRFEAYLGRKVDGVTDFADWTSTWPNLVRSTAWLAGCWRGSGIPPQPVRTDVDGAEAVVLTPWTTRRPAGSTRIFARWPPS